MPLNVAETTEFIAGSPGAYVFRLRITDTRGNGWRIEVPFAIE
jgi:hypothetical protein